MTTPYLMRQATPADIPALAELRWDFSPDEQAAELQPHDSFIAEFSTYLAEVIGSDDWGVWVAEDNGRIVANMYVRKVDKLPRPGKFGKRHGYVTNVYTVPELRGQGIGGALLERLTDWAREQGLTSLMLWPSNEAVPFYQRHGFDSCVMGKEL